MTEETVVTGDFGDWVAARGPALQRFAHLVAGSASDAQDLVQDALTGAYPRWPELSRTDTAEAYVRRSIVNASVSRWRRTHRMRSVADPEAHLAPAPDGSASSDDADLAWQLCATLPPQQRAAVVLRFYEDLPFAQIATILDCAEPTARSHVHRAVAALRHTLENGSDHD